MFTRLHLEKMVPSQEVMWTWLREDIQWRERLGVAPRHRHHLSGGRLMTWGRYMNSLAASANFPDIPEAVNDMQKFVLVLIMVEGLAQARRVKFTMNADKTNFSVSPSSFMVSVVYWVIILLIKVGYLQ